MKYVNEILLRFCNLNKNCLIYTIDIIFVALSKKSHTFTSWKCIIIIVDTHADLKKMPC